MTLPRFLSCLAFLLTLHTIGSQTDGAFRKFFDLSQAMMTGKPGATFLESHWSAMTNCMSISPSLLKAQDNAWDSFVEYYAANHGKTGADPWGDVGGTDDCVYHESWSNKDKPHYCGPATLQTIAFNESFQAIPIYQPCDFVSNFAYYRVVAEICHKASRQCLSEESRQAFVESFSVLGFGSSFFHASETHLGENFDTTMIQVLAFVGLQASVENLPTLGKPEVIRSLIATPQNRSANALVNKIVAGLLTKPPSEWDLDVLPKSDRSPYEPKEVPDFEMVLAGYISALMTVALPSAIATTLVRFLMQLFSMDKVKQEFILGTYLPTLLQSLSHFSFRISDRVTLLKKLITFGIQILYSFAFQETYFRVDLFLNTPANAIGGLLLPVLNLFASTFSGEAWWQHGVELGIQVYPGDERCRLHVPHAKWHEMSANAFLNLFYMTDDMIRMTSHRYSSEEALDGDAVFTLNQLLKFADEARSITVAVPAPALVEAFIKEVLDAFNFFDANADGEISYLELVTQIAEMVSRGSPFSDEDGGVRFLWLEAFVQRLLRDSESSLKVMV